MHLGRCFDCQWIVYLVTGYVAQWQAALFTDRTPHAATVDQITVPQSAPVHVPRSSFKSKSLSLAVITSVVLW
jgi:hypothetical protein